MGSQNADAVPARSAAVVPPQRMLRRWGRVAGCVALAIVTLFFAAMASLNVPAVSTALLRHVLSFAFTQVQGTATLGAVSLSTLAGTVEVENVDLSLPLLVGGSIRARVPRLHADVSTTALLLGRLEIQSVEARVAELEVALPDSSPEPRAQPPELTAGAGAWLPPLPAIEVGSARIEVDELAFSSGAANTVKAGGLRLSARGSLGRPTVSAAVDIDRAAVRGWGRADEIAAIHVEASLQETVGLLASLRAAARQTALVAQVRLPPTGAVPVLEDLHAGVSGSWGALDVSGAIDLADGANARLAATLTAVTLDVASALALPVALPGELASAVSGSVTAAGRLAQPRALAASARLSFAPDAQRCPVERRSAAARVVCPAGTLEADMSAGRIQLAALELTEGETHIRVAGTVPLDLDGVLDTPLTVAVRMPDAARYSALAGKRLAGQVDVDATVSGTLASPRGRVAIRAAGFSMNGTLLRGLDLQARYEDGVLFIERGRVEHEAARAQATGKIGVRDLLRAARGERGGEEPQLAFSLEGLSVRGAEVDNASLTGRLDNGALRIAASFFGEEARLTGHLSLAAPRRFAATLQAQNLDLDRIGRLHEALAGDLGGRLSGRIEASGGEPTWIPAVTVELDALSVRWKDLTAAAAAPLRAAFDPSGRVSVAGARFLLGDADEVILSGVARLPLPGAKGSARDQPLEARLEATIRDLGETLRKAGLELPIRGGLTVDASVSGTVARPGVAGRLELARPAGYGFTADRVAIALAPPDEQRRAGAILAGEISVTRATVSDIEVGDAELTLALSAQEATSTGSLWGGALGYEARYGLTSGLLDATARIHNFAAGPWIGRFAPKLAGKVAATVNGEVRTRIQKDAPLAGTANAHLTLSDAQAFGERVELSDALTVTLADGTVRVAVPALSTDFASASATATLATGRGGGVPGPGGGLASIGAIDFSAATTGRVDLGRVPPGLLEIAAIASLGGTLAFDLSASGTPSSAALTGTVKLADGRLEHQQFPHVLTGVTASLTASPGAVVLDELVANVGTGQVRASGRVGLSGTEITDLMATAAIRDVELAYPDDLVTETSACMDLWGTPGAPTVAGRVRLHAATYSPQVDLVALLKSLARVARLVPTSAPVVEGALSAPPAGGTGTGSGATAGSGNRGPQPAPAASAEPRYTACFPSGISVERGRHDGLFVDLKVDAREALSVENKLVSLSAGGALNISGPAAAPAVLGKIDISGGSIWLYRTSFELDTGSLRFDDPYAVNPLVDISAFAVKEGETIRLRMTGRADALVVDLSSPSGLSRAELVRLLVGRSSAEPETTLAEGASQLLRGQVSALLREELRGRTGFDIDLNPAPRDGHDYLYAIGRQVSARLHVRFLKAAEQDKSDELEAQYSVSRWLRIEARNTFDGGLSVGAKRRWEFD